MNKTIELGLAERIQLIGVFNQVKSDVETLESILKDIKEISITDDEKKDVNFREIKDEDNKVVSYAWDKAPLKSITLSDKTARFVIKFIEEKSKSEEITLADAPILEVNRKLKQDE